MRRYFMAAGGRALVKVAGKIRLGGPGEMGSPLAAYEIMIVVPGLLAEWQIPRQRVSTIHIPSHDSGSTHRASSKAAG